MRKPTPVTTSIMKFARPVDVQVEADVEAAGIEPGERCHERAGPDVLAAGVGRDGTRKGDEDRERPEPASDALGNGACRPARASESRQLVHPSVR